MKVSDFLMWFALAILFILLGVGLYAESLGETLLSNGQLLTIMILLLIVGCLNYIYTSLVYDLVSDMIDDTHDILNDLEKLAKKK